MPEIDFFLCREEKHEFADLLFKFDCMMIPHLDYETENYITISSLGEYQSYISENLVMSIIHPATFLYDLEMSSFKKNGIKFYYIQQRYGGPTIDFSSTGIIEETEKKIGTGSLSMYPYYYHKKNKFRLDQKNKDLFQMLRKYIKQKSQYVKVNKRGYWVGKKTIELCRYHNYSLVQQGEVNVMDLICD